MQMQCSPCVAWKLEMKFRRSYGLVVARVLFDSCNGPMICFHDGGFGHPEYEVREE